jgi:hypothetical protein
LRKVSADAEKDIMAMSEIKACYAGCFRPLHIKTVVRHIIFTAVFITLSSCGSHHSQHVYKLYPGPELPDSDVATLVFGEGVYAVEIDGLKVSSSDYGEIKLTPGEHHIRWGATFLISVMVNASGFDRIETGNDANLVAGHTYTIHADRTTGYGYRMYLWVEDTETGEVIAGTKIQ